MMKLFKNKNFNLPKIKLNSILFFVYVILFLFVLYHIYYSNKIIPGVFVGTVDLGGLTIEQAYKKILDKQKNLEDKIIFEYNQKQYLIDLNNILLDYSLDKTISQAFEIGRSKNIYIDNKNKILGLTKSYKVPAIYKYDETSFNNEILKIKGTFNKSFIDAYFYLDEQQVLQIKDASNGVKINDQEFFDLIISSLNNFDTSQKKLPIKITYPQINTKDLLPLYGSVNKILKKDFTVYYNKSFWNINKKQKIELIEIKKDKDLNYYLNINNSTFNSFIDHIKYEIEILPKGKVQEDKSGNVVQFELVQSGTQIDVIDFYQNFKNTFFDPVLTSVNVTTKVVDDFDIEKYGIYQLLGTGISKFTGSGAPRVHNLTLAAKKTNGVLVPPQGIYSLNKAIGAINGSTGYQVGYVISGGRTVLGEGGGVCQTSTTLFRAVLNAGLPIVSRYAHDYRVSYYEIDSPVGLDAAIFQPSLDFQFKNDTPNYILVQSSWNLEESTLTFKIFGTPDGRTVELTEPIVTNYTSPPPPLYQEDPNLPKGVVRQVDWSAPGSNVTFSRTVKRDDKVILEDTFVSRYYPWRAVFLVGTGE